MVNSYPLTLLGRTHQLQGAGSIWKNGSIWNPFQLLSIQRHICSAYVLFWQTCTRWRYLEGLINLETPVVFERMDVKNLPLPIVPEINFTWPSFFVKSCTFRRYLEVLIKAPGVFESMEILTTASASYLARDAIHLAFFLWRYVEVLIRAPVGLERM